KPENPYLKAGDCSTQWSSLSPENNEFSPRPVKVLQKTCPGKSQSSQFKPAGPLSDTAKVLNQPELLTKVLSKF
ncbi:MAG: hypothetical protein VX254_01285, partial [Planctomycetota bacterium]|nr:hypothetical protein [Planctomycetota bacterium]